MVKEKNAINCKLYWNGQMTAFEPSDIKTIFPKIFDMKWNADCKQEEDEKSTNEKFLEGILSECQKEWEDKTINDLIKEMKGIVIDEYFNNFYHNLLVKI